MKNAGAPGAIVGIWQDGQEPYIKAFGVQDTATGEPMTTDLHMRIGSNSKTFTITSILMLADQGKLNLDDPISKYVEGVPSGDQITLRHLAEMRSGLANYGGDLVSEMEQNLSREWTPQELLELSFSHPLLFTPGSEFDYSNTNTVLLGLVVEKVSGQSLKSFIEENIVEPEGLTHTVFPGGAEIPDPHSQGYITLPDGRVVDATDWNPSWGWASGNMISNLDDLRVWTRDFAEGKLISPAMQQEQRKFLLAPSEGEGALYGLALENNNGWLGHNGNIYSYMVFPYYLPEQNMTMVVMLNSGSDPRAGWVMMQDIASIISPDNPWPGIPTE
jgi:D-alanyl-D-alanine carboxypeptidase